MFKAIVLIILLLSLASRAVVYRVMEQPKAPASLIGQFNRSYLSHVLPQHWFDIIASKAPAVASFLVGLDPSVDTGAYQRWFILLLVGWLHFCFLSRWTRKLPYGITRKHLFVTPLALAVLFSLLKLGLSILTPLNLFLALWLGRFIDFALVLSFGGLLLLSLFSIPVSLAVLMADLVRFAVRITSDLWHGRKINLMRNDDQQQTKKEATLPGPVVKKIEVDGVKYDI